VTDEQTKLVEVDPKALLERFNQLLAQRENADTCTTYSGKIHEIGALFCDNRSTVRAALQAQPAPVVDGDVRCPNCGVHFQRIEDVDAHLAALAQKDSK
jgi:hypothetical protein